MDVCALVRWLCFGTVFTPLILPLIPYVEKLSTYGKLAVHSSQSKASPPIGYFLSSGQVFQSYYVFASLLNLSLLYSIHNFVGFGSVIAMFSGYKSAPSDSFVSLSAFDCGCLFASFAMQIQTFRRFYECFFVHSFSHSPTSWVLHMGGLAFYFNACFAPLVDSPFWCGALHTALSRLSKFLSGYFSGIPPNYSHDNFALVAKLEYWEVFVFLCSSLVFLYAGYQQHLAHRSLANLRKTKLLSDSSRDSPTSSRDSTTPAASSRGEPSSSLEQGTHLSSSRGEASASSHAGPRSRFPGPTDAGRHGPGSVSDDLPRAPARYTVPAGGWFDVVACPHYWFEVVLYASFVGFTLGQSVCAWLVLGFVVGNLTVTARKTREMYRQMKPSYPVKYAIIPYVT